MYNCVDLRPANPNYSSRHIESAYASGTSCFRIITVHADDACVPDLFAIWGKAMTYTYKESGKVKHGL